MMSRDQRQIAEGSLGAQIFLSYAREDEERVAELYQQLSAAGFRPWMDKEDIVGGERWRQSITRALECSDFFLACLSEHSVAKRGWIQRETREALDELKGMLDSDVYLIPVRLTECELPESLRELQCVDLFERDGWTRLVEAIQVGIERRLELSSRMLPDVQQVGAKTSLQETDVQVVRLAVGMLEVPTGVVPLGSPFYVRRLADDQLESQLKSSGTITTIHGARQTGKTSLLVRGVDYAKRHGATVIYLDFQSVFDESQSMDMDRFFRSLADEIAYRIRCSRASVDSRWEEPLSAKFKMTRFIEDAILRTTDRPAVLVLDEVDVLLKTSFYSEFFGLLRSWHNSRTVEEMWNKMSIVMSVSTHPTLLIDDTLQSPFNVGLEIVLEDLNEAQVRDLNDRHGKPLRSEEVSAAMELLGGQPYLIRQALYTVTSGTMAWPELVSAADSLDGPFGSHLRYYWRLLLDDPELLEAARKIVIEGTCPEEKTLLRLISACLVRQEGQNCFCRYALYKRFFRSRLR